MTNETGRLRQRLKAIGLSDPAIEAAWPEWWSDAADPSPSARLELRFSVARKLGLDPRSLVDEEGIPRFVWRDEARFKHLSGESELERAAISSFGRALGSLLVSATAIRGQITQATATGLRNAILRSQQFVRLVDLLALCWSAGFPVAHLRIFPAMQKRMAAMTVRVADRSVILLAKDSMYPAHVAFYLAHELAHILLGHLARDTSIVDLESEHPVFSTVDPEEIDADRFALQLLTGRTDPRILPSSGSYNAPALADAALKTAPAVQIEPGTIALCFGYSTQNWAVANSALKFIYSDPKPVWAEVNRLAARELDLDMIPADARSYLNAVLGGLPAA